MCKNKINKKTSSIFDEGFLYIYYMESLRTFEGYIDNKIKSLKKIKEIVDFIEKYNMKYFVIAMEMEDDDYMFEDIRKHNGVYKLEYVDYAYSKKGRLVDLLKLSEDVVDSLYRCCKENSRFDISFHLETGISSIEEFINILIVSKKKINFSKWIFSMLIENDLQEEANKFKFQDILFSTHPEAYKPFIDECFDITSNYVPLKIHPRIKIKYKELLGEYLYKSEVEYESEKYNL